MAQDKIQTSDMSDSAQAKENASGVELVCIGGAILNCTARVIRNVTSRCFLPRNM